MVEPGPAMAIASRQLLPLSLIRHEFATNSLKHGALSAPQGQIRVHWDVEEARVQQQLRRRWQERGGPPVSPPTSAGFGTRLIEFAAKHELGGRAELNYAPGGLEAEIVTPLSLVVHN